MAYLDFDGHLISGTNWTRTRAIITPPFDTDGQANKNFSALERRQIIAIWAAVAEDFAPFDIDITTGVAAGGMMRVAGCAYAPRLQRAQAGPLWCAKFAAARHAYPSPVGPERYIVNTQCTTYTLSRLPAVACRGAATRLCRRREAPVCRRLWDTRVHRRHLEL